MAISRQSLDEAYLATLKKMELSIRQEIKDSKEHSIMDMKKYNSVQQHLEKLQFTLDLIFHIRTEANMTRIPVSRVVRENINVYTNLSEKGWDDLFIATTASAQREAMQKQKINATKAEILSDISKKANLFFMDGINKSRARYITSHLDDKIRNRTIVTNYRHYILKPLSPLKKLDAPKTLNAKRTK